MLSCHLRSVLHACSSKKKSIFLVGLKFFNFQLFIKVSTRFIFSSNPLIYWYLASLLNADFIKHVKQKRLSNVNTFMCDLFCGFIRLKDSSQLTVKLAVAYFLLYTVIGTLMFVNFLPFT